MKTHCEHPCLTGLRAWARAVIACASIAALTAADARADVDIHFDPPAGTTFVESARITTSSSQDGMPGATQTRLTETRYVIRRDASGGYTVTTTPVNAPDLRADADTAATLAGMISAMEVEWDLDERGQLVRARNVEVALRQLAPMKPLLDAVLAALSSQGTTLQAVVEQAWRDRGLLGVMTGWQVSLDRTLARKATQQVPGIGPVACDLSIKFTAGPPCTGGPCLKVEFRYDSRDPAIGTGLSTMLTQAVANTLEAMAPGQDLSAVPLPVFKFTEARLELVDMRVIDPRTGLPHAQQLKRTVSGRARIEIPGEGDSGATDFRNVETQDYRFTYVSPR
jgi:hypothetical protein